MPSVSRRQHVMMARAAKDKDYAKSRGIDPKVAKEFIKADKEMGLWEDPNRDEESEQAARAELALKKIDW